VKEDETDHEERCLSAQKLKKSLDTKNMENKKSIARQELEQHCAKARCEGKHEEDSPDEDDDEGDDDDDDEDIK
jgi:hypothetical protein